MVGEKKIEPPCLSRLSCRCVYLSLSHHVSLFSLSPPHSCLCFYLFLYPTISFSLYPLTPVCTTIFLSLPNPVCVSIFLSFPPYLSLHSCLCIYLSLSLSLSLYLSLPFIFLSFFLSLSFYHTCLSFSLPSLSLYLSMSFPPLSLFSSLSLSFTIPVSLCIILSLISVFFDNISQILRVLASSICIY